MAEKVGIRWCSVLQSLYISSSCKG